MYLTGAWKTGQNLTLWPFQTLTTAPPLRQAPHTHTHTPNSLSETSASLCLVQWVKFAPPPPPSKVLSLNLSQVVNVPLALRECEKWVEGKGAEGALEGPGAPETWPF